MTKDRAALPDCRPDDGPWGSLRSLTAARIGLARAGASLATAPLLDLRLAHARARDAVHEPLDVPRLAMDIGGLGIAVLQAASAAVDQQQHLMRPDLGRRLAPESESALGPYAGDHDVVFVVADGLSARAAQVHAAPVLAAALPVLRADGWRIAPCAIVRHGRVAIGDSVATQLRAVCVVVLIGERPGLTAPDSMGAYLTWQPNARTTDAERNCISNIRPDGIAYADAAFKLLHLLHAMRERRVSGVALKDDSGRLLVGPAPHEKPGTTRAAD
jgi:ethanolamine ammonia-lyase small subunit